MSDLLLRSLPTIRLNPTSYSWKSDWRAPTSPTEKKPPHRAVDTLTRAVRGANDLALSFWDGLTVAEREKRRGVEERRQILYLRMKNADTLQRWQAAAQELDTLEGNEEWKNDPSPCEYNASLIEARLRDLDEARTNCDIGAMMYLVRTALSRDLGGMGNVDLYRHSFVGTKSLIERYVDSAIQTIEALVEKSALALPDDMSYKDLLEGILFARQSFGRSALLLSGGATFGMLHIGVLKALFEAKLLPRIISGASAGSIVCAVLCTRTDEEIPTLIETFPYGDLDVFEDSKSQNGFLSHLRRLLTEGSWSDVENLTRVMRGLMGDITFQEAYNRTRRILNICVSTESVYELPRLLNYVTAPNVMIWSAVAASCSVPLVFGAAHLLAKNPITGEPMPWNPTPQRWIDGSVDNDLPMTRLAEMFNVNHFIVSQVNPHIVPFLAKDDHLKPTYTKSSQGQQTATKDDPDWLYMITTLAKDEALHRMQFLAEIGIFPNFLTKLRSILSQKYSGDINILPEISVQDLPNILTNPTSDFMLRACLAGERATWPRLSRIRDQCAIELALDRAAHHLRARVVFSESQADLRRMATSTPWTSILASGNIPTIRQSQPSGPGVPRKTRRGSGSSVQLLAHHRRLLDLTDEETEEEERLEMQSRILHSHTATSGTPRKPRLRRAAKSHLGPLTISACASGDETSEFDFSKPMTPPLSKSEILVRPGIASLDATVVEADTEPTFSDACSQSAVPPSRSNILSPTEELDTTDPHSSDGDVDSRTDESVFDPEPYEQAWLHDMGGIAAGKDGPSQALLPSSDSRDLPTPEPPEPPPGGLWD